MIEYFIYAYGNQIVLVILCAIFGTLAHGVKKIYIKHVNDETKRTIARTVVAFVEQVWISIHGADKLRKALEVAETMFKKKGIDFDAEEMEILIEAALAEFNEVFKKPLLDEASAGGTYRVPDAESTEVTV